MKNLERIVDILSSFGDGHDSRSISGLLSATGIPLSSGYKLITALLEKGLLRKSARGMVALGPAAETFFFAPVKALPPHTPASLPRSPLPLVPRPSARWPECDPVLLELSDTTRFRRNPPFVIGFANASLSNPWRVAMARSLVAAVRRQRGRARLVVRDALDDPRLQVQQLDEMRALGIDVCILSAAASSDPALEQAIARLAGQGVPVIGVDRTCGAASHLVSFVSASDASIGRISALWLAEFIGGHGPVMLLSGRADATPCQARLLAARAVFAACPDIELLPAQFTNWDAAASYAHVAAHLRSRAAPAGVWSDCGIQGLGSVQAFSDAGFAPGTIPPHTGGDVNAMYKIALQRKVALCAVDYPAAMGAFSVQLALDTLSGRSVPRRVETNLDIAITRGHDTPSVRADVLVEHKVRWDLGDDFVHGTGWAPTGGTP